MWLITTADGSKMLCHLITDPNDYMVNNAMTGAFTLEFIRIFEPKAAKTPLQEHEEQVEKLKRIILSKAPEPLSR